MKHLFKFIFSGLALFFISGQEISAYTLPADTLKQMKVNGIKVKLYKVLSKDTWISISKKYKVSVAYLQTLNSGVENLKTGQIINIPTEEGTVTRYNSTSVTKQAVETPPVIKEPVKKQEESKYQKPVYHVIKKGETLFRVSKMYNQSVENLSEWNGIKNNEVKIGQRLVVNYVYQYKKNTESPETNAAADSHNQARQSHTIIEAPVEKEPGSRKSLQEQELKIQEQKYQDKLIASNDKSSPGLAEESNSITNIPAKSVNGRLIRQVNETGVASWIMDGEINQNKYYALHRNAPVGTIIKVTNRMNNKYVFVKVVGLLPETGDNDKLIIKISQAASNKINVLDSRFQAELSYGVAE
jgi:LysM repeat protein